MLNSIEDHAGFAAAVATQKRLEEGQAALFAEQAAILARNKHGSNRRDGATFQQQAIDALEGKVPQQGMLKADQKRLAEIAATLQLLSPALHRQPVEIEYERNAARAEAVAAREADVAAVRKRWDAARDALAAALTAENALIDSLIGAGFGRQPVSITSPMWLNRDWAQRDLGVKARYP